MADEPQLRYLIISERDAYDMQVTMDDAIRRGYTLVGGLQVVPLEDGGFGFFQAVLPPPSFPAGKVDFHRENWPNKISIE
jgi:hypothetical protein